MGRVSPGACRRARVAPPGTIKRLAPLCALLSELPNCTSAAQGAIYRAARQHAARCLSLTTWSLHQNTLRSVTAARQADSAESAAADRGLPHQAGRRSGAARLGISARSSARRAGAHQQPDEARDHGGLLPAVGGERGRVPAQQLKGGAPEGHEQQPSAGTHAASRVRVARSQGGCCTERHASAFTATACAQAAGRRR